MQISFSGHPLKQSPLQHYNIQAGTIRDNSATVSGHICEELETSSRWLQLEAKYCAGSNSACWNSFSKIPNLRQVLNCCLVWQRWMVICWVSLLQRQKSLFKTNKRLSYRLCERLHFQNLAKRLNSRLLLNASVVWWYNGIITEEIALFISFCL